jgi:hypothetical protein
MLPASLNRIKYSLSRKHAIASLRPRILHGDLQAGGQMAQGYCGRHFVHVLAAWATRSSENLFELGLQDTELSHPLLNRPAHRHAWRAYRGAMFSRP